MIHTEDMSEGVWMCAKSEAAIVKTLDKLTANPQPQSIADIIAHHHDSYRQSQVFRIGSKRASSGYLLTGEIAVKPGRRDEWLATYKRFAQPVFEKLLTDGDILGYGVDQEHYYTRPPGIRSTWVLVASPEAIDKVEAAFNAAEAARNPQENRMINLAYADMVDAPKIRTNLLRVTKWVRK
jgi:hypothetical protein